LTSLQSPATCCTATEPSLANSAPSNKVQTVSPNQATNAETLVPVRGYLADEAQRR
jgi:hypothetical protein